uniref:Gypsy retrotransposon integrase-like protein 1 n=1 Tax=Cyprinus carpio TaxID=7962 RepID=A0A8C1WKU1_CYPCA
MKGSDPSWLTLKGANGLDIPYIGYVVADVEIRGIVVPQKGIVVVQDHCLGTHRALLGMNVIAECWEELFQARPVKTIPLAEQQEWRRIVADCRRIQTARVRMDREDIGRVACRYALSIPARSEALVWVRVPQQDYGPEGWVLVEPHLDCQNVEVARGLAVVRRGRVPVKVRNESPYPIQLHRHQRLARVTTVGPHQVREERDVSFRQVCPTVVEVALTQSDVPPKKAGEGMPGHLRNESLRGEGLQEAQTRKLEELLTRWQHVFSTHDEDYGCTDVVRHQIPTGEAGPSRERYRPIPPTLYSEVRTLLQGMLDQGIVRESSSPWAAPIVLVQKKNGAWRFCVDYRKLNQVTKKDAFPLPRIEDSLASLTRSAWYSTLDLASGYWQVRVEEADREKTAFTTPFGLFEWDRMPFGLCNAPATFQRLMQRCLGGRLMESTLVYLDDVIVYSPDFESHLQHLEEVFQAMERYGLKLQPDKCHLLRREVKFLGHCVSAAGVAVDPEKVAAVREWSAPKTVRQVRSFLGFVGYYRRFIKGFSKIAKPLNQLLAGTGRPRGRGSPSIMWDPECEAAFQQLKQELLQAPILAYADFNLPFILYTDASNLGLGAVLAQRQEGAERVIAYASRSLHPAERNDANYSSFKLELLALKWALSEKFKDYLWGAKVQVITDNNPLVHLQTAKLGAVEQRWVAQLANYDYQLQYRPGREHVNADVLSRLPEERNREEEVTETGPVQDGGCMVGVVEAPGSQQEVIPLSWGWDPDRWRERQQGDERVKAVSRWLEQGQEPTPAERQAQGGMGRKLLGQWEKLRLREGVLCRVTHDPGMGDEICQVVVPEDQVQALLVAYHTQLGHQGQEKTVSLLRRHFYWPGLEASVGAFIQACPRCMLYKARREPKAPLVPIKARAPLHIVAMDFLTLGRPADRYQNILVVTDLFTKYSWAIPTLDQTANTTAMALWRTVFQPFGCPEFLHSDQGPNFESRVVKELCNLYGCTKTHTTSYHPQGNGGCERFNQTLLGLLGTLDQERQGDWVSALPALTQAYNNSVHSTTGYAPTFLMFGRHVRLPVDLMLGAPTRGEEVSLTEWVDRHHQHLQFAYGQVTKRIQVAADKSKRIYDRTAREAPLLPGERVLVRDNRRQGKGKLSDRWEAAPFVVVVQQRPGQPVYTIRPEGKAGPERTVHRNMIRPCPNYPRPREETPRQPVPVAP